MSVKMSIQLRQISLYIKTSQLYTLTYKLINTKANFKKNVSETFEEKFKDVLVQPKIKNETWENIRKYIMKSNIHSLNVDSTVMAVLQKKKLIDTGISYYQFLLKNNYDLNVTTQTFLLQLYEEKSTLDKNDKEFILNLYKHFMNTYVSFELKMTETLVKNLCNIDEWEEAIKVIKKFERNDPNFPHKPYSTLISYLYDCGKADKAYTYLLTYFKNRGAPFEHIYTSYLKYHLKNKDTVKKKIEELFLLWRQYGVYPSKKTITEYIEVFNKLGWSAKETELVGLKCTVCGQTISQILSDYDYERLCRVLEQRFVNQLYYVSNPTEMQRFMHFIKEGKPYDVVIDGLNFIYSNVHSYKKLQQMLMYYKNNNKKVLLIGRKHLEKIIKKLNLENLAHCFLVDNLSKDDIFILYAAVTSGRNAKLISKDFMRQHKFIIDDVEINTLFKRWQISQQYWIGSDAHNIHKLMKEVPIDAVAEKQFCFWHIPYIPHSTHLIRRHLSNNNWACFKICP